MGRRKKLYCPDCGEILKPIYERESEWVCENPNCPSNDSLAGSPLNSGRVKDYRECTTMCYAEFYGLNQEQINQFGHNCHRDAFLKSKNI